MIPGMNPKQLKQMERQMKKMGMQMKDIPNVEEVIIRCEDKDIVIKDAQVSLMNAMGQETYQIVGVSNEQAREMIIPEEDIEMVSHQANVSPTEAEKALKESNGDLAEAILKLAS